MKRTVSLVFCLGLLVSCQTHQKIAEHKVIDGHIEAANENDYARFKSFFHAEIEGYDFPNELKFKGFEELDKTYMTFINTVKKKATIKERLIKGNFVIDLEHLKTDRGELEIPVVYEMKDNKIYRIMFLR
ncbi:MAG: hypothetical protein HRU19_02800 [Pseudobacteriovorax sp.]|nr:hypothetical protein [Pseudobacteriovorax sp.]